MDTSNFNKTINRSLKFLENPKISAILRTIIILYASMVAPKLPDFFTDLFNDIFFRIFVIFLILWTEQKDPTFALLVAISFVVSMNVLTYRSNFENISYNKNTESIENTNNEEQLKDNEAVEKSENDENMDIETDSFQYDMDMEPDADNVRPPQIPVAQSMPYDYYMDPDMLAPEGIEPMNLNNMSPF